MSFLDWFVFYLVALFIDADGESQACKLFSLPMNPSEPDR